MPLLSPVSQQPANASTNFWTNLYLVVVLPFRLTKAFLLLCCSHRVVIACACLVLFPVFIFTTLVSSLIASVLNHMVFHSTSQIHRTPFPSSSSSSSSASSSASHNSSAMDEDNSDRESTEYPRDDMDYWLQRCSICFEAQLDLCLEYCRDQYCLDCFRRYAFPFRI